MATTAVNPGMSTLLQMLGNESSALTTPSVQSAIENAPPSDIVTLSNAAIEGQEVGELFDPAGSSSTSASAASTLISDLIANASSGTASAGSSQLPSLLAALQYQQVQGLLG